LAEGDNGLRRLSKIAVAARPPTPAVPEAPMASAAKTLLEAAHAFTERRRSDGLAA
jgi:hypothetical protein